MPTLACNSNGAWIGQACTEGSAPRFYFTRPAPFGAKIKATLVGAGAGVLALTGLLAISWLLPLETLQGVFGAATIARTMQVLWILAPLLSGFLVRERWISARYGSCSFGSEGFYDTGGSLSIPLDRIPEPHRRTPHGVLVRPLGSALLRIISPNVLIPADTPEEFDLIASLLLGAAPAPGSYVFEAGPEAQEGAAQEGAAQEGAAQQGST